MGDDLTTQQKSRLRRAFRETFEADNHGQAVKDMYGRFGELYGVSADSLRAIVAEDLRKKPQEYSELRGKLAARQATKRGEEKLRGTAVGLQQHPTRLSAERKKPTYNFFGQPGPIKPNKRAEKWLGKRRRTRSKQADTPTPTKASGQGKCPRCGNKVRFDADGSLTQHRAYGAFCGASSSPRQATKRRKGRPVSKVRHEATCAACMKKLGVRETDGRMLSHNHKGQKCSGSGRDPFEGRGGRFMKGLEVRTVVSGGLPGLGRRH